jgi:hypothetical protein
VNLKTAAVLFGFLAPLSAGTGSAADLHPIVEIETGYFFGGSETESGSRLTKQLSRLPRKQLTKFTA